MRFFSKSTSDDFPATASPSTPTFSPSSSSSTTTVGPARPIRLIYCDEKGKFQMDPEAVSVLHLLKGPLGVVSVCGRALQGKSFILNQLLGRSNGFQVASTHRPCTKGLWLWSTPIKKTALDGSKYNLLLLDSEGIDAYDQTGTYSTQIFSLVVLLSSMFIYNQMGGIDEAALDRLSLVTEMTKHIRVRASGGKTTASELGQFSPIFVWLLRDFYLDLAEDNRKITPRDYLEIALRPVNGGVRDVAAKNEIRESIRALFPDRDCFTLVRPMNSENELQLLDQIPLDNMRPDFKSGLDALTRFVFERTGPKQVGGAVMTGPIFARITQSFLDALNNGAVPTITSSWQSVEEAECERAYDSTSELYVSIFDRTKRPEDAAMREAHEEAVQKAITIFNSIALDVGPLGVQLECREEDQRREQEMRLENAPELVTNEEIVKEAWEIVNDSFLGSDRWSPESWLQKKEDILSTSLPTRSKAHDVIRRLLSSLGDPYTRFLSPEEFSKMARYDMSGIGVNIREIPDENGEVKLKVLGLILDGPAYTTGVRQGDELLSVNEVNVKGKSAFEALSIIQGPSDTSVNITVKHGNCGPVQSFDVQRQLIAKSPVYYRLEQMDNGKTSVGYVRLKEFNALARKDFVTAMKKLQGMGASVFVLDLRDNLGGLVLEGIEIAKLFLSKGETVIYTAGREPQNVKSILAETGPLITSPVMVLVNKNTASASEIVATALHDNCRAILVGEKTYGKGLIQSVFELRDGSGVMVTVGKYVTPNHLDINENGIDPDYAKLPAWNEASERLSECQKPECQKPECQNPECQKPECQKQQP